jgi:hypothetical protein
LVDRRRVSYTEVRAQLVQRLQEMKQFKGMMRKQ